MVQPDKVTEREYKAFLDDLGALIHKHLDATDLSMPRSSMQRIVFGMAVGKALRKLADTFDEGAAHAIEARARAEAGGDT